MAGFGCYNPYPRKFGGGKRAIQVVHEGLLEASDRAGLDVSEGSVEWCESLGQAAVIANGHAAAERAHYHIIPRKMTESLPVWEQALGITPAIGTTSYDRRMAVDARFRALTSNAEPDIRDVCANVTGRAFVGVSYVPLAQELRYWPGIKPGPPGLDWVSTQCMVFVTLTNQTVTDAEYLRIESTLYELLDNFLPAWMAFSIDRVDTVENESGFFLDFSPMDEVSL